MFLHWEWNGHVYLTIIKIVDDIFATGTEQALRFFATKFDQKFNLGEITYGLGRLQFLGLKIVQHEDL